MGCSSSKTPDESQQGRPTPFSDLHQQQPSSAQTKDAAGDQRHQTNKYASNGGGGAAANHGAAATATTVARVSLPPIHTDIVFALAHGGGGFFSSGEDRSLAAFNGSQVRAKHAKAHEKAVSDIVYAERTAHVYTASRDRTIKQWSMTEGGPASSLDLMQTFVGHTLPVSCVDVDQSDPTWLVSGARDYQLRFWDTTTGQCRNWTEVQQNVITDCRWIQGEQVVLQASEDLTLRVWDARTKDCVQSFSDGPYFALHCDVSPDGQYFLTGHNGFEGVGCEAKLFDRRMGKKVVEIQVGRQAVTDACFLASSSSSSSSSGLKILTASKDATMKVWDLSAIISAGSDVALSDTAVDVGLLATLEFDQTESVQSLACGPPPASSANQLQLASGHVNGRVSVWEFDLQTNQMVLQMQAKGTDE